MRRAAWVGALVLITACAHRPTGGSRAPRSVLVAAVQTSADLPPEYAQAVRAFAAAALLRRGYYVMPVQATEPLLVSGQSRAAAQTVGADAVLELRVERWSNREFAFEGILRDTKSGDILWQDRGASRARSGTSVNAGPLAVLVLPAALIEKAIASVGSRPSEAVARKTLSSTLSQLRAP
ncbi:MAG: GNA1162 family protein [Myxococcota bacterium]